MAIEFVGMDARSDNFSNPLRMAYPSGAQNGDFLILLAASNGEITLTEPSDWDVRFRGTYGATNAVLVAYHRIEDIDNAPIWQTFSKSGSASASGLLVGFRGVDPDTPFDTAIDGVSNPGGNTYFLNLPGITTSTDGAMRIGLTSSRYTAYQPPALPDLTYAGASEQRDPRVDGWYAVVESAGSVAGVSINTGENSWKFGFHTALRPDPNAGPTAKPWTRAFIVE